MSNQFLTNVSPPQEVIESLGAACSLRNKIWMKAILNESAHQKPCLVTVGSAHNQGTFGLPNLLVNEGYILTPLAKTAPTPKSVLLRDLLTGSNQISFFKEAKAIIPLEEDMNDAAKQAKNSNEELVVCKQRGDEFLFRLRYRRTRICCIIGYI